MGELQKLSLTLSIYSSSARYFTTLLSLRAHVRPLTMQAIRFAR